MIIAGYLRVDLSFNCICFCLCFPHAVAVAVLDVVLLFCLLYCCFCFLPICTLARIYLSTFRLCAESSRARDPPYSSRCKQMFSNEFFNSHATVKQLQWRPSAMAMTVHDVEFDNFRGRGEVGSVCLFIRGYGSLTNSRSSAR